MMIKKLIMIRK